MAEEFKVKVGVEVDASGIQGQLDKIKGGKLNVDLDISKASARVDELKKKIESLSNIKVNIGGLGNVSTSSGTVDGFVKNAKNQLKNVSDTFLKLQNIQKEIKVSRQNLSILDAKTDSQAIDNLTKKINGLITEYGKLYAAKSKSLSSSEISALNKEYSANIAPIKQTAEAAKELLSVQKQIGNLEVKIKGLDDNADANQIRELNSQLLTLKSTYNELRASLNGQLSSGQLKSLNDAITSTENKLTQLEAKLADVKGKKATDISGNIGNFGIDNEADKIERSFNRIVKATEDAQTAMDRFQLAKEHLDSANQDFLNADTEEKKAAAIDNLIAKYDEYKTSLSAVKSQIELNTRAEKENVAAKKLESDKNTFSLGMSKWLKNNSAAAEDFGGRLRKLQAELKTCDSVRFNGIKSEFKQITTEAELAGKTGLTFGDRFKQQFSKLGSYFSAASVIMAGIQVGKEAIQNVIDIDTQMTELYRVTDLSTTQYSQLYDKLTVSAKEYGVALTDLISATADWSRAGFDADTAAGLAEVTSIYQHIADLDYDTSVENLLTAYKGFESELKNTYGDDAKSAAMHIADIYNEIDNNYATTAADIGEAVKRSASALSLAGNSLEETAGMVTGITEVTQDPEKAGNSLKVLSMRIRGMKGELQDLGEEVDDNVENISQMQGKILNLTHGKVNIFGDDGSFKSTYEIMQGIANIYDDLTDSDRADLLETIAGKNRANEVAALIQNWDRVEQATESAANSTGSAMKEQEKYADSIQGRLNSLKSMWQQLSNTLVNSDAIKAAVSAFTKLLSVLDKIIDTIGGFGTVGLIGTLFVGHEKGGGISSIIKNITQAFSGFKNIFSSIKSGTGILGAFTGNAHAMATGIGLVTSAIAIGISAFQNWREEQARLRQEAIDNSNSFNDAYGSFEQAYIQYADKTSLTTEEEDNLKSAIDGTINALGNKAGALRDAAGAASEYSSNLDDIAKAEAQEAQRTANAAKTAAKEQMTDWLGSGAGSYQWLSWKDSKADFKLPEKDSKEWSIIKDVVENPSFKKYLNNSVYGKDLTNSDITFRFNRDADFDGLIEQYNYALEIRDRLSDYASKNNDDSILDSDAYKTASESVETMSSDLETLTQQTYAAEKANYQMANGIPKTVDQFYDMQDAILSASSSAVNGRAAIASLIESEYSGVFDLSSAEAQVKQFQSLVKDIDSIDSTKEKTFETFIDLKTKVNDGECSVGDYTKAMQNANDAINKIAETDAGTANALRIQLGLEVDADGNIDDEISKLRDKFVKQLTDNNVEAKVAEKFVDGLNNTELEAAVNLVASGEIDLKNIDTKNLDASIKQKIEDYSEYLKAIQFNLDIDAETTGLDDLNTALSESRAATGLTADSIQKVEDRYSELEGYNPAGLFEKTTTGVRLNTEALQSLEEQYVATNKAASDQKLGALAKRYKEIEELRDSVAKDSNEYKSYQLQLDNLQDEIDSAQLAAAAYDGLTSAYNNWINAKSSGQAGDMYDQIIEGQEAAQKLADEGKWGNSELQNFIEMFTAPDAMDNATPDQFADAWGNAISKSERYFQEGRAGIDNFLSDVASANSELVKMNQDGSWEIQPGFDIEDWAKAAGVAESTVESVFGMMEEYGVDVPIGIDETSIDDLVAKSNSASEALKSSLGQDFSIEVNTDVSSAEEATDEIDKLKSQRDEINNSSATVEVKEQGVEAVNASIQATIDKKIELEQPAYMQLDTSQVKSTMIDALTALQNYQNAVDEVKNLEMQQDAGIEIDTTQLDNAKKKVDETAQAIAQLDGDVKVAIGLDASDSVEDIKKKIESGEVKLTVDTDVNKTATEELASNIEKIESKDVTITAKVEGLDDVKELNKNIDIAAKVDGNIEDLTKFTEAAKGLNDVSDNITTTVSANVYGNLDKNKNLDRLSSFIDNAKELDNVKSSYVDVTANVNGNLDENSINIDNLSEFAEGAKALQDAKSSNVSVAANIEGNVIDTPEYKIDNLKKFTDSSKDIKSVGSDTKAKITADIKGNVINTFEAQIDNLKKFTDSAKDIHEIGPDTKAKITADIEGNVKDTREYKIDNLKKFTDSAKDIKSIGEDTKANVEANITGNVINTFEAQIDNLKKFTDSAKDIKNVGSDTKANVEANITGNVTNTFEMQIDNLKKFTDSAKGIKDIGENTKANVDANVTGNVIDTFEYKIDNLKKFTDSAKDIKSIGSDVKANVEANINGNVKDTFEFQIDNLKKFTDSAKDIKSIGPDAKASVEANVAGNVIDTYEYKIDNIKKFTDSARDIKSISGNTKANVEANITGNVINTFEAQIDNLKKFTDSAKGIKDIGSNVKANVEANITGNVTNTFEMQIDNLKTFVDSAKGIKDIGSDTQASVEANVGGNVLDINADKISNLKTFADNAKDVSGVGSTVVKVTADIAGNVIDTRESQIKNLKTFADSAKGVSSVGSTVSKVTANITGNVINTNTDNITKLKTFADSAKGVSDVGSTVSKVTADIAGNVINTDASNITKLKMFVDNAQGVSSIGSTAAKITADIAGNISSENIATLSQFGSVAASLPQSTTVSVNANVDTEGISNAKSLLQGLNDAGVMRNYNASVTVTTNVDTSGVDSYQPGEKTGTVKYNVDQSAVDAWSAPDKTGTITYNPSVSALTDSQLHKTGTITYKAKVEGGPVVNGTAHANGTAGSSFSNGDWSTKSSGTALMGELGPELIVRDGRYFTVGDSGAEFAQYKKGDIIFNHKQTEELFKNGYVASGGGRGRALVEGTAFANVNHATWKPGVQTSSSSSKSSKSSSSKSSSSKSSSSKSSSDEKEFEESLDWIEIAISRIERAISNLDRTASSTYKTWTARNSALNSQIGETRNEIELQQRAYERYIQQANSVGLSESYASKVRDGTIDIETITDEDLNDKIKDYQTWYEKALDCLDAIDELRESESKLYEQRFNNVSTKYDGYLGVIEHEKDMLDEFISQTETAGYIVSTKYYDALSANAKKNIEELKKERDELTSELNNAVNSGTIAKYSESWYSMVNSVDEVTKSIEEQNTALIEYKKNIQEINWSIFDMLQEKISNVADESEFLINLMSNKKLYNDNGQLTDEGMATMGQHGVKYDTYMAQANKYAQEMQKIDKELANDPYNKDLLDRRQELLEAQQEAILNAEDEKDAIKDMVEEGINKELDALQDLIDKYNDSLDSAKDLYEYQKKVKEQTKEIADIQKQLSAYAGDDSEETKKKVQELKVSLEDAQNDLQETEYDQYISDQQKLLDDLYSDYETILNMRLDDVDALMSDMIAEINANASTIGTTITEQADKVGYTLSDSMNTIWLSGNGSISSVIAMYGNKFDTALTTTNTALNNISTNIANMISQLNKLAGTNIKAAGTSSAATEKPASKPSTSTPSQPQQTQQKQISVGGKINAGNARIYADSYGNGGGTQTFRSDPIYTVLSERNGYVLTRWYKLSSGYTGWFKKSDVSAYKVGAKSIARNEMAWTQEDGTEMIMRPSDGAILTPLAKNDSVLTSAASGNIWNMANSPADFIKDNLDLDKIDSNATATTQANYTQNLDKIVFNLPNVKNYDELLSAMQRDRNFERLISSMTIDRLAGKSSLAKGKAIR